MNKLAVFVEGYTEVVFVEKLIEEIAGKANVLIEHRKIRGGGAHRRSYAQVRAARKNSGERYFVLIVDCGGDRLVKERIREEHQNLTSVRARDRLRDPCRLVRQVNQALCIRV
jgi:hypothetical protein